MWFFSQNITKLEKTYGPWKCNWSGLPNSVSWESNYYNFNVSFSRTWSYNGDSGTEIIYPTNVIIESDTDSMIEDLIYESSKGSGVLTISENKHLGIRRASIKAIHDTNNLSETFDLTQIPVPWNVHVIVTNHTSEELNIEFLGNLDMLTNNEPSDVKGNWDINHKTISAFGGQNFMDVGYINDINGTDTISKTEKLTFTFNTYNSGGSKVTKNYKLYMTLNEDGTTAGPGDRITQSNILENLISNQVYNDKILIFEKEVTIFDGLEFVFYITIE